MDAFHEHGVNELQDAEGHGRFARFLDIEKAARRSLAPENDSVPLFDVDLVGRSATWNVNTEPLFGKHLIRNSHGDGLHPFEDLRRR